MLFYHHMKKASCCIHVATEQYSSAVFFSRVKALEKSQRSKTDHTFWLEPETPREAKMLLQHFCHHTGRKKLLPNWLTQYLSLAFTKIINGESNNDRMAAAVAPGSSLASASRGASASALPPVAPAGDDSISAGTSATDGSPADTGAAPAETPDPLPPAPAADTGDADAKAAKRAKDQAADDNFLHNVKFYVEGVEGNVPG